MEFYNIAGNIVEIASDKLENLRGFSVFRIPNTEKVKPLLSFRLCGTIKDWAIEPFICFTLGTDTAEVLRNEDCFLFRIIAPDGCRWLTDIRKEGDSYCAVSNMDGHTEGNPLFLTFSVWLAFGIAALSKQTIAIHASTVCFNRRAILCLGESGTGKSTHTSLWLEHIPNTGLLNDDSPFLRIETGQVKAYGSPWSGKTDCYKDESWLVAAFVRLHQAPYNQIRRLKGIEAIGALLPSFPPALAAESKLEAQVHEVMALILDNTPVYRLDCLPNSDAAQLVYNTLKLDGRL